MWFIRRDVVTSRKPHELIITVVTDIADTGKYQRGIAQIAFNLNDEQQWTVASATEHAVWSLIGENYLKGHCEKTFSAIKSEHIEKFLAWTSKTLIGSGIARFEMVKYQIFPTRGQIPDFPHLRSNSRFSPREVKFQIFLTWGQIPDFPHLRSNSRFSPLEFDHVHVFYHNFFPRTGKMIFRSKLNIFSRCTTGCWYVDSQQPTAWKTIIHMLQKGTPAGTN